MSNKKGGGMNLEGHRLTFKFIHQVLGVIEIDSQSPGY